MFVRLTRNIILILLITIQSVDAQDYDPIINDIQKLNDQMEQWFEEGNLQKIGEIYADDAVILSPLRTVRGKEDIADYWKMIQNPVKWELEVIEVSQDEEELYLNEFYEALDNKPPDWRVRGVEIDDESVVYQLGHSSLTTKDETGQLQTSDVDFILIWHVLPDGTFKILLDTYTWQK